MLGYIFIHFTQWCHVSWTITCCNHDKYTVTSGSACASTLLTDTAKEQFQNEIWYLQCISFWFSGEISYMRNWTLMDQIFWMCSNLTWITLLKGPSLLGINKLTEDDNTTIFEIHSWDTYSTMLLPVECEVCFLELALPCDIFRKTEYKNNNGKHNIIHNLFYHGLLLLTQLLFYNTNVLR